jgi:branched-chain amino acid transport system ATP-binding protein
LLQLQNVYVSYGSIDAIVNIDIEVPKGKIVALIGSNGAGKSTVLKSISGISSIKQGTIRYEEMNISSLSIEKRAQMGIGHVLEGRRVFRNLSIEDNLRLAIHFRKKMSRKMQDQLIQETYEKFELLGQRKKEKAGGLSGGQLQLLIFAIASICKPKILLLDEPSLGLSPLMVKQVYEIVKSFNKEGMTILLAEQMATFALEVADYAYVLDKGSVVKFGETEYLRRDYGKEGLAKAYLGK